LAVFVNQRMVSGWASNGAALWAWVTSIAVHLIVLTCFGFVTFSRSEVQMVQRPAPTAKISRIKKLTSSAPLIPKPRVKRPAKAISVKDENGPLSVNPVFGAAKSRSQDLPNLANPSVSGDGLLLTGAGAFARTTEFFGSSTDERKVCYLVDCSGSMLGVFGQVRTELAESIARLQPDQFFCIIFFGGDRLIEFGDGCLVRATEQAKSAALEFIDSVEPAGQTDALAALERAVQFRDRMGMRPAVIYFLTDGFELTTEGRQRFLQRTANLLARFAPGTSINTIGFCSLREDRKILRMIAKQTGGEFVFTSGF
jgi:hypothetical protein